MSRIESMQGFNTRHVSDVVVAVVQLPSSVPLFVTLWAAARQASLSLTISQSLPKFMSTESWYHRTISSSVALISYLQSFLASGSFPMSLFFASGGQSTGASPSASVLPVNIQNWFPLGWTGWITLQSKGLSSLLQSNISKVSILWPICSTEESRV